MTPAFGSFPSGIQKRKASMMGIPYDIMGMKSTSSCRLSRML